MTFVVCAQLLTVERIAGAPKHPGLETEPMRICLFAIFYAHLFVCYFLNENTKEVKCPWMNNNYWKARKYKGQNIVTYQQ